MTKLFKFVVGSTIALTMIICFAQGVNAWGAMFDRINKSYELSNSVSGRAYQSIVGLRKNTSADMYIKQDFYKLSGSSYNRVNAEICPFKSTGIINYGCVIAHTASGTNTYKGIWTQNSSGQMNASLEVSNKIPDALQ